MESNITRSATKILMVSFVLWYLLRQTGLGKAYTSDILAIPRSFAAGEGLNSANRYQ